VDGDPRLVPAQSLSRRPALAGVVLAAGRASRLAGRPKPLLELDGVPLVARVVDALQAVVVPPVIVVAGALRERIAQATATRPVRLLPQPDPASELIDSQRLGLAAVPPGHDVIVALADQPLLAPSSLQALAQAWAQRPEGVEVLYPRVTGEPGNPVVASARAVAQVLASPSGIGLRQWREAHPSAAQPWDTEDTAFTLDLDTPQDLLAFEQSTGRALRWPQEA